jgi:hypothetical protein
MRGSDYPGRRWDIWRTKVAEFACALRGSRVANKRRGGHTMETAILLR